MGKIELTVCAARNLHNMEVFGVPDPFVRLIAGDKKYKTKVVKDNLSPVWEETFRFQIADEMSTQIRFEVWNKNTYDDDLMGIYTLSVGGLTKGVVRDGWYILDKSKTQAELHIRVLAVDFGMPPKPEEQWMVTTDINRDPVRRAIEDGTWRPGQKTAPPPSGPPAAQVIVQPQVQPQVIVQPQPQVVVQQAPQQQPQVQYVTQPPPQQQQPQPQVVYVQAPPQQQPAYVQPAYQQPPPPAAYAAPPQQPYYQQQPPPPQQQYYQPPPQPQQQYYQPPPPPQQQPQGYYAPAPGYRY